MKRNLEMLCQGSAKKLHPIVTQDGGTLEPTQDKVAHNLNLDLEIMEHMVGKMKWNSCDLDLELGTGKHGSDRGEEDGMDK